MGRRTRRYRTPRRDSGFEHARKHIAEAEALSAELGGADEDVKAYFFSMSPDARADVLEEYEELHGEVARSYAEQTIPKWQAGAVRMSGMVASRLFALLPSHMPIEHKYRLVESLWRHVAPKSSKVLYINPATPADEVASAVKVTLDQIASDYTIPAAMESRFKWLSGGDATLKQQLLNHLRAQERALAAESVRTVLPTIVQHVGASEPSYVTRASQVFQIGNTALRLEYTDRVQGVSETPPPPPPSDYSGCLIIILLLVIGGLVALVANV